MTEKAPKGEKVLCKVSAEISPECLKKIKILAIQRDTTLSQQITRLLERSVAKRKIEIDEEETI